MTRDLLVANGHGLVIRENLKCLTDLLHLFVNGKGPKCGAKLAVEVISHLDGLGDLNPKFTCSHRELSLVC